MQLSLWLGNIVEYLSVYTVWALNTSLLSVNRALTLGGGLPHLEHLNLSGCLTVTGAGLQDLVSACPSLNDEHFYYCDNINGNVFLWRRDAFLGSDVCFKDAF